MTHLEALDHIVVAVADLDRAVADYSTILGRAVSWRGSHPGQGTENALFQLANTYVELLTPSGEGPLADGLRHRLESKGEGMVALAFAAADADAFATSMRQRGIGVDGPRDGAGCESEGARERERDRRWRSVMLAAESTRGVVTFAIEHASPALPLALATGAADAVATAVDHVVVMSGDIEATRGVYRDTLGLRLALDREFPERGLRLLFFRVGGLTVEIAGRLGDAEATPGDDALWGMAYRVDDIDAARSRLVEAGVDVTMVRPGQKKGTRVCTLRNATPGVGTHGVATLLIGPEPGDG